jgi:hypothetical protein
MVSAKSVIVALVAVIALSALAYCLWPGKKLAVAKKPAKACAMKNPGKSCGMFGDVTNCPRVYEPMMLGENNSIYALFRGSVHDPWIKRECKFNPPLLRGAAENDMEFAFGGRGGGLLPASEGEGNEISTSYGYDVRKALIEGGYGQFC